MDYPFLKRHILYTWNEPSSSSTICLININSVNIKQINKVLNFVKKRMKGGRTGSSEEKLGNRERGREEGD